MALYKCRVRSYLRRRKGGVSALGALGDQFRVNHTRTGCYAIKGPNVIYGVYRVSIRPGYGVSPLRLACAYRQIKSLRAWSKPPCVGRPRPAVSLRRDYAVRGERARRGRSGWRPRQPPAGPCEGTRRSVALEAWKPPGEGAGWERPGRACSPFANAWIRLSSRRMRIRIRPNRPR